MLPKYLILVRFPIAYKIPNLRLGPATEPGYDTWVNLQQCVLGSSGGEGECTGHPLS